MMFLIHPIVFERLRAMRAEELRREADRYRLAALTERGRGREPGAAGNLLARLRQLLARGRPAAGTKQKGSEGRLVPGGASRKSPTGMVNEFKES